MAPAGFKSSLALDASSLEFCWVRSYGLGSNGANNELRFASLRPITGRFVSSRGNLTGQHRGLWWVACSRMIRCLLLRRGIRIPER
jgi:hypothetical protein